MGDLNLRQLHFKPNRILIKKELKKLFSIPFVNFANCWVLIDEEDEKRLNTQMFYYLPTR